MVSHTHGMRLRLEGTKDFKPVASSLAMERTATYEELLNLQPNQLICRNVVLMPGDLKKNLWLFLDIGAATR